jgi:hypothetical protein
MQQTQQPTPSAPVRKPWRRPTLQKLHVSLDTAQKGGSFQDGGISTFTDA